MLLSILTRYVKNYKMSCISEFCKWLFESFRIYKSQASQQVPKSDSKFIFSLKILKVLVACLEFFSTELYGNVWEFQNYKTYCKFI